MRIAALWSGFNKDYELVPANHGKQDILTFIGEVIRKVMRWAGPRMIFSHPVLAIRHVIETKKEKRALQ